MFYSILSARVTDKKNLKHLINRVELHPLDFWLCNSEYSIVDSGLLLNKSSVFVFTQLGIIF